VLLPVSASKSGDWCPLLVGVDKSGDWCLLPVGVGKSRFGAPSS